MTRAMHPSEARFVPVDVAALMTGLPVENITGKIARGIWRAGREFIEREGVTLVDLDGYTQWILEGPGPKGPKHAPKEVDVPTALYRHFNKAGDLLYVGISLSVIARLAQHRRSPWVEDIAKVEVQKFDSRPKALAAERTAIIMERPLHNVTHAVKNAQDG